jgi:hypothetical protein
MRTLTPTTFSAGTGEGESEHDEQDDEHVWADVAVYGARWGEEAME